MKLVINLSLLASHCDVEVLSTESGDALNVYSNGRSTRLNVKGITKDGVSTICHYNQRALQALHHLVGKGVNYQNVPNRNIIYY